MNDELEEFKKWIDEKMEPDGRINLSKHPDLVKFYKRIFGLEKTVMPEKTGLGDVVSFDLTYKGRKQKK